MNHEQIKSKYCTVTEAMEILGVEKEDIDEMIRAGKLQVRKVKNRSDVLIPRPLVECVNGGFDFQT